jgi:hypothetical protein
MVNNVRNESPDLIEPVQDAIALDHDTNPYLLKIRGATSPSRQSILTVRILLDIY